jgi:indolepyruvate ferredoxin oxidoreductase alpha subunit
MEKLKNDMKNFGTKVIFDGGTELGVIGVGVGAAYAKYVAEELKLNKLRILKLSLTYPLPKSSLINFVSGVDKVLVLEDGEPIVERLLRNLLDIEGITKLVLGKDNNIVESIGELDPDKIVNALSKLRKIKFKKNSKPILKSITRLGGLCAGCPHMASYYVIKEVLRNKGGGIVVGDRGCYNQGANYPLEVLDTCMNMGASIGVAYGLAKVGIKKPIIAIIGDSTFFHAGLSTLANACYNNAKFVVIILDNGWISMTGHQPSLSSGIKANGKPTLRIYPEKIAKAIGVSFIKVVDPFDVNMAKNILRMALEKGGVSMVIFRHECTLQEQRRLRNKDEKKSTFYIDDKKCIGCKLCLSETGCPALIFNGRKMGIDESVCTGCGLCAYICKFNAIQKRSELNE